MEIITIMVSALLGAVLTWTTSTVLYKKQSTIETRWTLFQSICDEMYASKKLIASYFNELGKIAVDSVRKKRPANMYILI
ncbi:MAG: hypothetical protein ACLTDX_10550, partial [[Clostridium] innocuum]